MREILFRGKSTKNNKWAYGYYVYDGILKEHLILWNEDNEYADRGEYIDPKTLGQYTGLKDKNENKIFEGDILSYSDINESTGKYIVKWKDSSSQFVAMNDINFIPTWIWDKLQIIGNIHDNKELIK